MNKHYENFDVVIQQSPEGFQASVFDSPAGQSPRPDSFQYPFSQDEFEDFLSTLGRHRENPHEARRALQAMGERLFKCVFAKNVLRAFDHSLGRTSDKSGLRIRLWLNDVPSLADLPWEYLWREGEVDPLALLPETQVVRYLGVGRPERRAISLPLCVGLMISNPRGDLDVETEGNRLREALSAVKGVEIEEIKPTVSALRTELRTGRFHIFHFIGHGGFEGNASYLTLLNDEGDEDRLFAEDLGPLFQDNGSLRLAFLNACESGRASPRNCFTGIAQRLVEIGLPAVVAMQFRISDDGAKVLAEAFYKELARTGRADLALTDARKEVWARKNYVEWATPVLYMRSSDGRVFELQDVEKAQKKRSWDELDSMIEALVGGRLVVFLGPDVNGCRTEGEQSDLFPPNDQEIAGYLGSQIPDNAAQYLSDHDRHDLVRVSQYLETRIDRRRLCRVLTHFLERKDEPTELHKFLAGIPTILHDKGYGECGQLIVTSNYDNALEKAFADKAIDHHVVFYRWEGVEGSGFWHKPPVGEPRFIRIGREYQDVSAQSQTVILKIHGMVSKERKENVGTDNFVVTEDNYIDYMTGRPVDSFIPAHLMTQLKECSILFLGYRLRDWSLRVIFRRIWGDGGPASKCWVVRDNGDEIDAEFWAEHATTLSMNLKTFVKEFRSRLVGWPDSGGR